MLILSQVHHKDLCGMVVHLIHARHFIRALGFMQNVIILPRLYAINYNKPLHINSTLHAKDHIMSFSESIPTS